MDKPPEATRILIVDDEPEARQVLVEVLGTAGYTPQEAASGSGALARAREEPPDLILLDVGLFQVDWLEVCRHLKGDPRTAHARILVISGLQDEELKARAVAVGADGYLTKPVAPGTLLARVRGLLRTGGAP